MVMIGLLKENPIFYGSSKISTSFWLQCNCCANADDSSPGSYKIKYVYSFALEPEEHQPSGTCNFSRIDNAQL